MSLQVLPRPPKGKKVGDQRCSLEAMIVHTCRRANGEVPPVHSSVREVYSRNFSFTEFQEVVRRKEQEGADE